MKSTDSSEEDHQARSNFVRGLVQVAHWPTLSPGVSSPRPPRTIVQFWNDLDRLPEDVRECIESWEMLKRQGFDVLLFDDANAKDFIRRRLGARHETAYATCYHPAMRSDYFRLCYIMLEGGCYIDVDDVYNGGMMEHLFDDLSVFTLDLSNIAL